MVRILFLFGCFFGLSEIASSAESPKSQKKSSAQTSLAKLSSKPAQGQSLAQALPQSSAEKAQSPLEEAQLKTLLKKISSMDFFSSGSKPRSKKGQPVLTISNQRKAVSSRRFLASGEFFSEEDFTARKHDPKEVKRLTQDLQNKLAGLKSVCSLNAPLEQKIQAFQKQIHSVEQSASVLANQYKLSDDPRVLSLVNALAFYLDWENLDFQKQIKSPDQKKMEESLSYWADTFQRSMRVDFNIPENISMEEFPEGWLRDIGQALKCLAESAQSI